MTSNTETIEVASVPETQEPKGIKKASAGAGRAHVASKKGKSGKKASAAKKAPKAPKKPKIEKGAARDGSKTAKVLDLLRQQGGVTSKELIKATGWQPHSVRGFISGTVSKKMGLAVTSTKSENGERTYSLKP